MKNLAKLFADRSFLTTFFALVTLIATRICHANADTTVAIVGVVQALCLSADAVLTANPSAQPGTTTTTLEVTKTDPVKP